MKKNILVCLTSMLLLLVFVSPGFAESAKRNIDVVYTNVQLVINGRIIVPKDVTGAVVEPFIYEGTTYLPVRAVSEALGKTVEWDSDTRTVYVSGGQEAKNPAQEQPRQQTAQTQQTPSTATATNVSTESAQTTVFVSSSSKLIHTVFNCSGMKNYREMTLAEAREISSSYCSKCAAHLKDAE